MSRSSAGMTLLGLFPATEGTGGVQTSGRIAWEAHLGGFYTGLLLYGFFDRPPSVDDDAQEGVAPAA